MKYRDDLVQGGKMQDQRRPFEETIIGVIACLPNCIDLGPIVTLLKKTTISINHDLIIEVWTKELLKRGLVTDKFGVTESLLEQKELAEERRRRREERRKTKKVMNILGQKIPGEK